MILLNRSIFFEQNICSNAKEDLRLKIICDNLLFSKQNVIEEDFADSKQEQKDEIVGVTLSSLLTQILQRLLSNFYPVKQEE